MSGSTSADFTGAGGAPTVVSSLAVAPNQIRLNFSEAMATTNLTDTASYTVTGGTTVTVTSVVAITDLRSVIITTSGQRTGESYVIDVVGALTDTAGNAIS